MPVFNDNDLGVNSEPIFLPETQPTRETSFGDTFFAGIRRETGIIQGGLQTEDREIAQAFLDDTGIENASFDWTQRIDEIEAAGFGNRLEDFVDVTDELGYQQRLIQLQREQEDTETLLSAPLTQSVPAYLAAGILNPLNAVFMAGTGGAGALAVAGRTAAIGFGTEAANEFLLQQGQRTRSIEESMINIGATTFLAGILGAGAGALDANARKALSDKLDFDIRDTGKLPEDKSIGAAEMSVAYGLATAFDNSFGAATLFGKAKLNPIMDMGVNSQSNTAKAASFKMAENAMQMKENRKFVPSASAVESHVKAYNGPMFEARRFSTQMRVESQKAGVRMSQKEWDREVYFALGRNEHQNPHVMKAATEYRERVFAPILKDLQETGLLKGEPRFKNSVGYVTQLWRGDVIQQQRGDFVREMTNWLSGEARAANADLSRAELQQIAGDIADKLTDNPAGMIDAALLEKLNLVPNAGFLKRRTLDIDPERFEKFLETDMNSVQQAYVRSTAPRIELHKAFDGDWDLEESVIPKIREEYDQLERATTDPKQKKKINNRMERDIEVVRALRDRLLGTYGAPANPANYFVRASRFMRELSYVTLLGGMTLSALPDLARTAMTQGLSNQARSLVSMGSNLELNKLIKAELRSFGVATEMALQTRARSIAEIGEPMGFGTAVERGLHQLANRFGDISLMNPWNNVMKMNAGIVASNNINRIAQKVSRGTANVNDITRLASSGIDEDMAKLIAEQVGKHGESTGGTTLMRIDQWDDTPQVKRAAKTIKAAINRDVDTAIVTPGIGDRPLWFSTELGKAIGQFKSFGFAATNRVTALGLQRKDAAALNGLLLSVALGALVVESKSAVSGRTVDRDPQAYLQDAIDRSGVTGLLMDADAISERVFGFGVLDRVPSRYEGRGQFGAVFGVNVGTFENMTHAIHGISTDELSEKDVHNVRKLIPMQNIFYTRWLLDQYAEPAVAEALGAEK